MNTFTISPDEIHQLSDAAFLDCKRVVISLLHKGADVNSKSLRGYTALHLAAKQGHAAMVKILFYWGAKLTIRDCWGNMPLDLAIEEGHEETIETLRAMGAK